VALSKTLPLSTGASATYHRVIKVTVDVTGGRAIVRIGQYLDQASRDAGKEPMSTRDESFDLPSALVSSVGTAIYGELKTISDFADAVDV